MGTKVLTNTINFVLKSIVKFIFQKEGKEIEGVLKTLFAHAASSRFV